MTEPAILSPDLADILGNATISPMFEFDGRNGDYDYYLGDREPDDVTLWQEGDYLIRTCSGSDNPAVALEHEGEVVGFYLDLMVWVDERHRGLGHAARLVTAYCDAFGLDGIAHLAEIAGPAMGFSPGGWAAHMSAVRDAGHEPASPTP